MWTPAFLLLVPVLAAATNLGLRHRVLDPGLPELPFLDWADLALPDAVPADALSAPLLKENVETFVDLLRTSDDLASSYYQVALQTDETPKPESWDYSTVKVCHLQNADSQTFVFHLSTDGKPFALDYFVSPINHDGSCPTPALSSAEIMPRLQQLNTTFLYRRPTSPPLPQLRAPPPMTPEGEIVQPIPEKTFLQKYWIYIAALLLVLLFGGGPEEGSGGGNGGGAGGGR